jgi:hypothetical protein
MMTMGIASRTTSLAAAMLLGACLHAAQTSGSAPSPAAAPDPVATAEAPWPPPLPATDPGRGTVDNCAALFDLLARQAALHQQLQLLAHHFRSLALLVSADGPQCPEGVKKLYQAYTADWGHGPTDWQSYLDGRPLIFAWRSPYDGTPMLASVVLPKGYTTDASFPLYFELHASSPGDGPAMRLTLAGVDHAQGDAGKRRDGFHVYPWNRGLTEYHNAGEFGLQECLDQVDQYLDTDPARQYLFGFSMGGGGTWNYGSITEATRGWAALGIYSCTTEPNAFEAWALHATPVWVCCGEKDPWRPHNERVRDLLTRIGNPPDYTMVKGEGHAYRTDEQGLMLDFLAKHVNAHPSIVRNRVVVVRAFGDDAIGGCWVNGRPVDLEPSSGSGLASVHDGTNVISVHVVNRCWAGGVALSLASPDGPVISDASWSCALAAPDAAWTAPGFDDSSWPHAQAICAFRDFIAAATASHSPFASLVNDGAAFIGPPAVMRYRADFASGAGPVSVLIRGTGLGCRLWLNGAAIGGGDLANQSKSLPTITGSAVAGENVLAVETTSAQPKGAGAFFKCSLFHPTADGGIARVASGPGWRASGTDAGGWQSNAFDDRGWTPVDQSWINSCYDGGADGSGDGSFTSYFIAPGDLYMRKTFTVSHR